MLILGPPGSGKTHSLRTILSAGMKAFGIFTEPGSLAVLSDVLPKMHYAYVASASEEWGSIIASAKLLGSLDISAVLKTDGHRNQHNQFMQILQLCNDFVDQHGKHWGPISNLGPDVVFFVDSLTGINKMVQGLLAGDLPSMTMPQFGAAQNLISKFVDKITATSTSHFVLTAHVLYDKDEITGGYKYLVSTIGRRLAPVLPYFFTDFVLAQRQGATFTWQTYVAQADLRVAYLPLQKAVPQDFSYLADVWRKQRLATEQQEQTITKELQ